MLTPRMISDQSLTQSDYSKDHLLFSTKNKKVIRMFKDKACGQQIEEFVGPRAKLYSRKTHEDGKHEKKCKGVKVGCEKDNLSRRI